MTAEAQRLAIAEEHGWSKNPNGNGRGKDTWTGPKGQLEILPPDYLNDLNAIAEARCSLIAKPIQRVEFLNHLRAILTRKLDRAVSDYDLVDSSASDQTEAILRRFGKWKD